VQTYKVELECEPSQTFRCTLAAQSLDIDIKKKLRHDFNVNVDIESEWNVGLIVGASGSGKSTLARSMFDEKNFKVELDEERPIIDQFPEELTYDQCVDLLTAIGLTAVVCWIRPVKTLSNGQKARAEAALALAKNLDLCALDEWTSVVDRTVAKVMSHCVQKSFRKNKKKVVLISCHYDVIDWLNPDWIIDCNEQKFIDRRSLHLDQRQRSEKLKFDVREIDKSSWAYFSKYHYLSDKLAGGQNICFGLFHEDKQIGFQCFSNYVPDRPGRARILHSNRTVIHPDYAGMGLGILLINETSKIIRSRGYVVMAKFSSTPVYKAMIKTGLWELLKEDVQIGRMRTGKTLGRMGAGKSGGFRENVKTYSFRFIGHYKS
jgi:ABC-type dipeptide/oligopeptide/nickel transport system ATPase subunit